MRKEETAIIDAKFWDNLFLQGRMPWDRSDTPTKLQQFLQTESKLTQKVFIPGCGTGYEIASFLQHGHSVVAMDYSQEAVNKAKRTLGSNASAVLHGDVFNAKFNNRFDLMYERAFLAALPRDRWPDYFCMLDRIICDGGYLVGYFVISDDYHSRYPPFCLRTGELSQWLSPKFKLIECHDVEDSVDIFKGKEHWMVWQKYSLGL